jgi:hypothetical protein
MQEKILSKAICGFNGQDVGCAEYVLHVIPQMATFSSAWFLSKLDAPA